VRVVVCGAGATAVDDDARAAGRADVAAAGVVVAVGDESGLDAAAVVDVDARAAGVMGSVSGRGAVVLCGADGVRSATCAGSAELIPSATTAHPATASEAVVAPTTRPTDMGSVCQVWLL
jgi:hypothetical protein